MADAPGPYLRTGLDHRTIDGVTFGVALAGKWPYKLVHYINGRRVSVGKFADALQYRLDLGSEEANRPSCEGVSGSGVSDKETRTA